MGLDFEQAQFKNLEQTDRTGADDDGVSLDQALHFMRGGISCHVGVSGVRG